MLLRRAFKNSQRKSLFHVGRCCRSSAIEKSRSDYVSLRLKGTSEIAALAR
jgi:hypothetical protein